ncbi:UDP-glucose 4-epimerase GalE [Bdellovibrio bacteriovorus]|uniref:UDP-glucose 4-epimerase GalE n=1 Tax=Bdellovibrio bacteriovorus TaxID=959 RepID=UPI0035A63E23
MRVLVTGGAGYIGSHTVSVLLRSGYQVVVFDNMTTGFRAAIGAGVEFVNGDVRSVSDLGNVLQKYSIDAVVHFAAKLVVPESIVQPVEYYQNNTAGVLSLLQACIANGVRKIVFSSTAAVYGDALASGMVTENLQAKPLNPYGFSKLMSEQILRDCEEPHGIRSVCLRYFNVAGAAEDGKNGQRTANATHLIKVASQAACGKRASVGIFGTDYPTPDGTGVRDYIHVEDLADLHVLALNYLNEGGKSEIFNCGYGHGFSVREVIDTVKKVSGVDFKVEEQPRRAGDAATLVADSSKVRKAFNWTPKRDNLELICQTAYEWERSLG